MKKLRILLLLFIFSISFFFSSQTVKATVDTNTDIVDFQRAQGDSDYRKDDFDMVNWKNGIYAIDTTLGGCVEGASCPQVYRAGALTIGATAIASLYNPPASGITYLADTVENLGIAKPAYAQTGSGFNALRPILRLWRGFRDFIYLFFVIIFAATGIAIMFRMRLSPQVTITIQSALPRLVIGLVLVTFSYAISGLMIDFMYVLISLGALVLGGAAGVDVPALQRQFTDQGFLGGLGALFSLLPASTRETNWWNTLLNIANNLNPVGVVQNAVSSIVSGFINNVRGTGPGLGATIGKEFLSSTLVRVILSLIVLWMILRLFFQLLQSYISVILLVIFGPLQIALGVIPGMPGFNSWIKSLIGQLMVFVGVSYVLIIGQLFARSGNLGTSGLWRPPLLLGSGIIGDNLDSIIALGILLIVHQVPAAIRQAFGIRGLGLFNPGEAWQGGTSPIRAPINATWQAGERAAGQAVVSRFGGWTAARGAAATAARAATGGIPS